MLSLPEELLLLAINDEKGSLFPTVSFRFALVAAILLQLELENYIEYKDKKIILKKRTCKENHIFNEVLKHIKEFPKEKNTRFWISKIDTKMRKLLPKFLDQLAREKILYKRDKKFLGIFNLKRYPVKDTASKSEIKNRIRETILNNKKPDKKTIELTVLVNTCGLINKFFTKEERNHVKTKIKEIRKNNIFINDILDSIRFLGN